MHQIHPFINVCAYFRFVNSLGEATELEITAKLMVHTKETLNTYLDMHLNKP